MCVKSDLNKLCIEKAFLIKLYAEQRKVLWECTVGMTPKNTGLMYTCVSVCMYDNTVTG